jgi:hypothetical protein
MSFQDILHDFDTLPMQLEDATLQNISVSTKIRITCVTADIYEHS